MSRIFRRFQSTSASSIASQFVARYTHAPPTVLGEMLSARQTHALASTLNLPAPMTPHVLPGWHLVYFTPTQMGSELGRDGSDTTFNPPAPFTRRMWAGGEMVWSPGVDLVLDTHCVESTRLLGAAPKTTRAGEEMIVVQVEKVLRNEQGSVALVDKRNWIFRPEITLPKSPAAKPDVVPFPEAQYTRDLCQTNVALFRFSALTFNGHKIHYNKEWCHAVEGHRDCVVHGPLNLINLLNFWRDVHQDHQGAPRSIVYRATNPLYVGEPYRMCLDGEVEGVSEMRIVDSFGDISMTATVKR